MKPAVLLLFLLVSSAFAQVVLKLQVLDSYDSLTINGKQGVCAGATGFCEESRTTCPDPLHCENVIENDLPTANYEVPEWIPEGSKLLPKLITLHTYNPSTSAVATHFAAVVSYGAGSLMAQTDNNGNYRCFLSDGVPPPQDNHGQTVYWWEPQYADTPMEGWDSIPSEDTSVCPNVTHPAEDDYAWCKGAVDGSLYIYLAEKHDLYCRWLDNNQPPSQPTQLNMVHDYDEDHSSAIITFYLPQYFFGRFPIHSFDLQYKLGPGGSIPATAETKVCFPRGSPMPGWCGDHLTTIPAAVNALASPPDPFQKYTYTVSLDPTIKYVFGIRANTYTKSSTENITLVIPPWKAPRCYDTFPEQKVGTVLPLEHSCPKASPWLKNGQPCELQCNDPKYTGHIDVTCWAPFSATEPKSMPDPNFHYDYSGSCTPKACVQPYPTFTDGDLPAASDCRAQSVAHATVCNIDCYHDHDNAAAQVKCEFGEWKTSGQCVPKCNDAPSRENAEFDVCVPGAALGSECHGRCLHGYHPRNNADVIHATCNINHGWDYDTDCEEDPCPSLPDAIVDGEWPPACAGYASGDICYGDCVTTHYELVPMEAQCVKGHWEVVAPNTVFGECIPECPVDAPFTDPYHFDACSDNVEGATCDGVCLDGWHAVNTETDHINVVYAKCSEETDHVWKLHGICVEDPCNPADLGLLHGQDNWDCGTLNTDGTIPHGRVCTGSCDSTHYGSPIAKCLYGEFPASEIKGTCQPKCTDEPFAPSNAHWLETCAGKVAGDHCDGACDTDYVVSSTTPYAICEDQGALGHNWAVSGSCIEKPCSPKPTAPVDGSFPDSCNGLYSGGTCYGGCDPTHTGLPEIACYKGNWQYPIVGECKPQCVDDPTHPLAEWSNCPDVTEGGECPGDCKDGYEGTAVATCGSNHNWNTDGVNCIASPCRDPIPSMTFVTWPTVDPITGVASGTVVPGTCPELYGGDASAKCFEGHWVNLENDCHPECQVGPTLANGKIVTPYTLPFDASTTNKVFATCNEGWVAVPDPLYFLCSGTTHQFYANGECKEAPCDAGELATTYHGMGTWSCPQGSGHGAVCTAPCVNHHSGSITATCQNGDWVNYAGTCTNLCYQQPNLGTGSLGSLITCGVDVAPGTPCSGVCKKGYGGSFGAICGLITPHEWYINDECHELDCVDPKADVPGGAWLMCNNYHDEYCDGVCNRGFLGSFKVLCNEGEWQDVIGGCEPHCVDPVVDDKAEYDSCPDAHNLQKCHGHCKDGYLPDTGVEATCHADFDTQYWEPGTCVWTPCVDPDHESTAFGSFSAPPCKVETPWGETCEAVCTTGYQAHPTLGIPKLLCVKGKWEKNDGKCEPINACQPRPPCPANFHTLYPILSRNEQAGSVDAIAPLITPKICRDHTPKLATPVAGGIQYDHVTFDVYWPRHVEIEAITGTDRTYAPYTGDCVDTEYMSFHNSADDDYFYVEIRLALKTLNALGCKFSSNIIKCTFWANATEHFKLGPAPEFVQHIAVRWPVDIIIPGDLGVIETTFEAYPGPLYDARITAFVMHPNAQILHADMVFLLMMPAPYMGSDLAMTLPSRVTGTPGIDDECTFYGTVDRCFQQISITVKPATHDPDTGVALPEPCTPGGLRDYSGDYTIAGKSVCIPTGDLPDPSLYPGCTDPPGSYGGWGKGFKVTTADFCEGQLDYDPTTHLTATLTTYSSTDGIHPFHDLHDLFNAEETVYFEVGTAWEDDLKRPFDISSITLDKVEVSSDGGTTYYDLYTADPLFDHELFTLIIPTDPKLKAFSVEMDTTKSVAYPWLSPLLTPGYVVGFSFRATVTVAYALRTSQQVRLMTPQLFTVQASTDTIFSVPPSAGLASGSSAVGAAIGATAGVVVIAACIAVALYVRARRRNGYVSESL